MKTIIAGSRRVMHEETGEYLVDLAVKLSGWEITEVIHGDCRGIDKAAGRWGKKMGIKVTPMPADWESYGKKAGTLRNREMALVGEGAIVIPLPSSTGSWDMVHAAWERLLPIYVLPREHINEALNKIPPGEG